MARGAVEVVAVGVIAIRILVALNQPPARRNDVQHAVHERRPEGMPATHRTFHAVGRTLVVPHGQQPERQHDGIRMFGEHAPEHFRAAPPRQRAQFVVGQVAWLADELPGLRIVFGVHLQSPASTIACDARGDAHVLAQARPGRVVSPGNALARRPERDEEIVAERPMFRHLLELRHHRRKHLVRPVLRVDVAHAHRFALAVATPQPDQHAVKSRPVERVRVRQKVVHGHRVEAPAAADGLLPRRRIRAQRHGACYAGNDQSLRQHPHFSPPCL